ncbi:MAG: hypothetical protein JO353_13970 [Phycisphaerae bacterium]|nr:hypothetical protein [Phycisphaerae bacterium]
MNWHPFHYLSTLQWVTVAVAAGLIVAGCATIRVTDTPRTATEQFLESEAITKCVSQLATDSLRDRKVFVDYSYLANFTTTQPTDNQEQAFLVGELRAKLLLSGVRLVEKREQAQVVIEVRSGGIGVDRYDYLLGLPQTTLGSVPGQSTAGSLAITPEIAILKTIKQKGYAGVTVVAYWADTGELLASSGPFVGVTRREDFWFFGFGPRTTGDIPPAQK